MNQEKPLDALIIDCLRTTKNGMTCSEIAAETGKTTNQVYDKLQIMTKNGVTEKNLNKRYVLKYAAAHVDVDAHDAAVLPVKIYPISAITDEDDADSIASDIGERIKEESVTMAPKAKKDSAMSQNKEPCAVAIDQSTTGTCIVPSALDVQIAGSHYKDCKIQPIEFIEANSIAFLEGCVIKRVTRHNKPTGKGRQDIEKAIHELQLLLELRYGQRNKQNA